MYRLTRLNFFGWLLGFLLITHQGYSQTQLTNLPTLWITTSNNTAITSKENWTSGTLTTLAQGMEGVYQGEIEIRGRGNSTWGMAKKPYRIRLKEKYNLLGLPAKERNWVLLANYADKSLLRNAITFEMSQFMKLPFSCHYQLVDVYINGQYEGNYTLTDHVQVADTRIAAEELETTDTSLPTISGGYFLEINGTSMYEPVYFVTTHKGIPITVKSPDEETINNQQLEYIKNYINAFEETLFSNNYKDPTLGYRKYVDMASLVNWYIGCELSANPDSFWSTYFVKRRNDDKIYFGPLWDYDIAYNNDNRLTKVPYRHMTEIGFGLKPWIQRLLTDENFRIAVRDRWNELKNQGFKSHILHKLDQRINEIEASQRKNFERWDILDKVVYNEIGTRGTYQNEANYLREFIEHRFEWLDVEFNGINTNYFYKLIQRSTNKALTHHEHRVVQRLQQAHEDNDEFLWKLVPLPNLTFQLVHKKTGLALGGANSAEHTQLELRESDPSNPTQQWTTSQMDQHFFRFTNGYDLSLNNAGGNIWDNNPITQQNKSTYNSNQEWKLVIGENIDYENCRAQLTPSALPSQPTCNSLITLSTNCVGANCDQYTYEWSGNGLQKTGASIQVNHTMPGAYTYTVTGKKQGCNNAVKTFTINVAPCTTLQEFVSCVEAENSAGTGPISDDSNASNGKTRGSKGSINEYVQYNVSNVPLDGIYEVTLRYSSEIEGEILISNANNSVSKITLEPTHSWNISFTEKTIPLYLSKGDNSIKIESVGIGSIRQDKICIKGKISNNPQTPDPGNGENPPVNCDFILSAQSNQSNYICQTPINLSAHCTGNNCNGLTYQWSGHGLSSTDATTSFTPTQDGMYTFTVNASKNGCSAQQQSVTVQVNSCTPNGNNNPISFRSCHEAEQASGSGAITEDPNASNGLTRGSAQNNNEYVQYSIPNVPSAGIYTIQLRYSSEREGQIRISNTTTSISTTVTAPTTHSWNIAFTEIEAQIALNQGTNIVRIESINNSNIRQDKLCVVNGVTTNIPPTDEEEEPSNPISCNFTIVASSDQSIYACNTPILLQAQCTGTDCEAVSYQWSGHGLSATQRQASFTPSTSGNYTFNVIATKPGCEAVSKTVHVIVESCPTNGENISYSQCLEAELANGSGAISDDPNASNGLTRGNTDRNNHYVDYQLQNVPTSGELQMTLRYSSNQATTVGVWVNNSFIQHIDLPTTHSWNIVFNEITTTIAVQAGNNIIRIQDVGIASTRQDKICLTGTLSGDTSTPPPSNPDPTCHFSITATTAKTQYACNEAILLSTNCSGADCGAITYNWSGHQINKTGSELRFDQLPTGNYTYQVSANKSGCTPITKQIQFTVNACEDATPPPSGQPFALCLEAENSTGTGAITDDPNASAGRTRGTKDAPSHSVAYSIPNVPENGLYEITLRYSAEQAAQIDISVGEYSTLQLLPPTHSWNIVFTESTFTIPLTKGTNTLHIMGQGNVSVRQDRLCIRNTNANQDARILSSNLSNENAAAIPEKSLKEIGLNIYPNPASSLIHISTYLHQDEVATLVIYDLLGRKVVSNTLNGKGSIDKHTITLPSVPPGTYLVSLSSIHRNEIQRIVIVP